MVKKAKSIFSRKSVAVASVCGTVVSVVMCLLFTALLTCMINGQTLASENTKTAVPVILYVSHVAGSLIAALLSDEKKAITAILAIAGSYLLLAAVNILFWDGTYDTVLLKLLSGLLAYATVFLILLRRKQGRRPSKKYRSR